MDRERREEMKRSKQRKKSPATPPSRRSAKKSAPPSVADEKPAVTEGRILERPGGFYWQEKAGGEEYGPFATRAEAEADMQSDGGAEPESVQEAESELGINEWIDPDTGAPAEEHGPRIEDH
jgi:hypothetical protein